MFEAGDRAGARLAFMAVLDHGDRDPASLFVKSGTFWTYHDNARVREYAASAFYLALIPDSQERRTERIRRTRRLLCTAWRASPGTVEQLRQVAGLTEAEAQQVIDAKHACVEGASWRTKNAPRAPRCDESYDVFPDLFGPGGCGIGWYPHCGVKIPAAESLPNVLSQADIDASLVDLKEELRRVIAYAHVHVELRFRVAGKTGRVIDVEVIGLKGEAASLAARHARRVGFPRFQSETAEFRHVVEW